MSIDENSVVIVGSGLTGTIAAWSLVKAGIPVVMIESGNSFPMDPHIRFRHRELRRPLTPPIRDNAPYAEFANLADGTARWIKAPRMGGRSNFWSGIVLRYAEQDFSEGKQIHPKFRWPITYADIAPYYEKVETLIRVRGGKASFDTLPACKIARERQVGAEWRKVADECDRLGRSLTVTPDVYGSDTIISAIASPQNIAIRLISKLRRSNKFRLIPNAHVAKVQLDRHQSKASAVEYIDTKTGALHKQDAKAVVLAAGSLSSPKILLNSTCPTFPQGLGNSQGLLGRYLHDHPVEYAKISTDFVFSRLNDREKGGLYITRQNYAQSQPLTALAFLLYGGTGEHQPVVLHEGLTLDNPSLASAASVDKCNMSVCFFGTQIPKAENYVSLHPDQKDRYGLPLLQINTRFSDDERENMRRGRALMPKMIEAAGYRVLSFASQLEPPGTSVHYGGTARMHHSSEYGVLDEWNRVRDIQNLLVVDASCFTTCVEKNPTLTAMALSMRAAEKLIQDYSE